MKKAQQELAITDFFNFANENFTSFPFQQWLSQQPPRELLKKPVTELKWLKPPFAL